MQIKWDKETVYRVELVPEYVFAEIRSQDDETWELAYYWYSYRLYFEEDTDVYPKPASAWNIISPRFMEDRKNKDDSVDEKDKEWKTASSAEELMERVKEDIPFWIEFLENNELIETREKENSIIDDPDSIWCYWDEKPNRAEPGII